MSNTSATRLRHECNTNGTIATRVKVLILITRRVKTYFHASILTIQLMNNYKEKNNFILKTTGNASFPCQNAFKKCTTKTELCNSESYIKKLYSRLQVQCVITHSTTASFLIKLYVKLTTFFQQELFRTRKNECQILKKHLK